MGGRKSEEGRKAEEGRWKGWFLLLNALCVCVCLFYNGLSNNAGDGKCVFFNMHITELVRQLTGDRKIIGH